MDSPPRIVGRKPRSVRQILTLLNNPSYGSEKACVGFRPSVPQSQRGHKARIQTARKRLARTTSRPSGRARGRARAESARLVAAARNHTPIGPTEVSFARCAAVDREAAFVQQ